MEPNFKKLALVVLIMVIKELVVVGGSGWWWLMIISNEGMLNIDSNITENAHTVDEAISQKLPRDLVTWARF